MSGRTGPGRHQPSSLTQEDTVSSDASAPALVVPAVTDPLAREVAAFGAVHPEVTDLGRSTAIWREVIGLVVRSEH
ncbi:hypothetical protein GMA12_11440 [Kocuria sediminis]|uniref:Uncharacterized protein n=1 Tax=Kocuria sediminis TaxID=1038857 RepID=A0A6N8GLH6_9MICC|nr:hypothetical protein [Kocuria sediminis]MUN63748.1 hypothetical protein [Kocuria sediminis]